MKTKFRSLMTAACVWAVFITSARAQTCESLINLGFSPNAGDIAAHPSVSNITPWTNGSELADDPFGFGIYHMPDNDFGNGYAGLTVPHGSFGYQWGFEGSFDMTTALPWQVCSISFDYDVLGHNGEAILALALGSWSGQAYLPSTGEYSDTSTDNFDIIQTTGIRTYGSVIFDFLSGNLTVTATGSPVLNPSNTQVYAPYVAPLPSGFQLSSGTHPIDILVSNTSLVTSSFFDATEESTSGQDAFYRIDNFQVIAAQIPEPSAALLAGVGALFLLRRRR